MELSDLRLALRRYWPVAVLSMAVWLAIGLAVGVLPEKRYEASAVVLASPAEAAQASPAQAANFQVPAIVARVGSRRFRDLVKVELPQEAADASVELRAENEPGTGIISIRAESTNAAAAAAWATTAGEVLLTEHQDVLLVLELLDPASVPTDPFSPRPVPSLLGAVLAGLLTAIVATAAVSRAKHALDFEAEVRRRLGVPFLGYLPAVRAMRKPVGMLEVMRQGDPQFIEAVHSVRTNIEVMLIEAETDRVRARSIAICSWSSGEGKSTLASALAISWATAGVDVVVADADLRRPALHTRLGEPFGEGLAEAAGADPMKLVRQTMQPRLGFLPAGVPERHPTDVIAVNLPRVVDRVIQSGRFLVIDSPPLHGVAETPMILSVASHTVLVVDASSAKLPELEKAARQLEQSGIVLLGVVINRARRGRATSPYGPYGANTLAPRASLGNGPDPQRDAPGAPGARTAPSPAANPPPPPVS